MRVLTFDDLKRARKKTTQNSACFICGEFGHWANKCPSRKRTKTLTDTDKNNIRIDDDGVSKTRKKRYNKKETVKEEGLKLFGGEAKKLGFGTSVDGKRREEEFQINFDDEINERRKKAHEMKQWELAACVAANEVNERKKVLAIYQDDNDTNIGDGKTAIDERRGIKTKENNVLTGVVNRSYDVVDLCEEKSNLVNSKKNVKLHLKKKSVAQKKLDTQKRKD